MTWLHGSQLSIGSVSQSWSFGSAGTRAQACLLNKIRLNPRLAQQPNSEAMDPRRGTDQAGSLVGLERRPHLLSHNASQGCGHGGEVASRSI